ncbi:DUF416 family protein [Oscillatoriales cyanobacterium LEGE 11467]|uniref:DUF416 family protein n=1 Tax=Zarconia navalis LEGE 11467 TaxID=1828826 RepID=A0A928VZ03_9CYAN|nr:YjaG family protein [Zarconia navalis]MBE9040891.1 DUF416 family protein [Zarconia navalis LEGE 11467]
MNIEYFRNNILTKELKILSKLHIVAFAASCCEQLFPFYKTFSKMENWGDPQIPRKALDTIWSIAKGESVDLDEVWLLSDRCCSRGICPSDDDRNSHYESSSLFIEAEHLIYSICIILDSYTEITAYDAISISNYVERTLEYYINDFDASFQKKCQGYTLKEQIENFQHHPLVVNEVAKETEDLQKLKEAQVLTLDFLEWLRTSSRKEGWVFINFLKESRSPTATTDRP